MLDQDFKLASIIHKGFTQHKELNPQIFDEEQRIRPEVRKKLILAANDFIDTLNIDNIDFEDIVIVGSIVNYNWNPYSDVDLHIIFDFKEIDENIELVSEFFMAKKSLWNQDHDVKIYEYDVELYGQDINEENASGGIYSLMKNEWVKKPEPEQYEVSESSLIKKTKYFIKLLNDVLELDATDETKIKKLKAIKEKIKKYRKSGLETGGEYSEENLTFKMLRRSGYLEKLSDIKNDLEDKMMSLSEGLMLGYKKFPDRYFDLNTNEEFTHSEINKHPVWYKEEYDNNGKRIYWEDSHGRWEKWKYDEDGNEIYWERNDGDWVKWKYDENKLLVYYEKSNGYWAKWERDTDGNKLYYENSDGHVEDNRNQIQEGLMLQYKDLSTPELWFKDLVNQMEIYEENLVGIDKVITFHINGVPYMEYYDFSNLFNYCYDYIDSVLENKFGMDVNKVHAFLQDMMKKYYNIDLQTARMNVVFYNRT